MIIERWLQRYGIGSATLYWHARALAQTFLALTLSPILTLVAA